MGSKYSIPAALRSMFLVLGCVLIAIGLFLSLVGLSDGNEARVLLGIYGAACGVGLLVPASVIHLLILLGQSSDKQIELLQELLRHARVTARYSAEAKAALEAPGEKSHLRPVGSDLRAELAAEEALGLGSPPKTPQAIPPQRRNSGQQSRKQPLR